ncbi:MAG: putative ABC transporter permease [Firmicutes bacterium]|nr:putative ABC transporter permease [Bacillota bacterium]
MLIRFFIYGLFGWAMEIFWTGTSSLIGGDLRLRGTTYLWMFPIYGLAVFLEPVHNSIRFLPWLVRGGIWVVIILTIEYVAGWTLKSVVGLCPWDYSGSTKYAIGGLIRLDYVPAWFVAGLLFERLHDIITSPAMLGLK